MELNKLPDVSPATAADKLDAFLNSSTPEHPLPDNVRKVVESERDTVELKGLDNTKQLTPGPALAILLDPAIVTIDDAELPAHVQTLMDTATKHTSRISTTMWVALSVLMGGSAIAAFAVRMTFNPMLLSTIVFILALVWMIRPKDPVANLRYDRIELDDALTIAQYRRELPEPRPSHSHLRLRTPNGQPNPQPSAPGPAATQARPSAKTSRERAKRIAEVHAAIAELDQEWLEYELDLRAWFITKPQLRNNNDPIIAAYRGAYATLRDKADELTDTATENQITAAQHAARTALKTWHDANDFAEARGVNNLSPSEGAALARLYGLVSQLNDPATPKAMWPQLIATITRTMDKLTTVPFTLDYIAKLPVIEAESRLRELAP